LIFSHMVTPNSSNLYVTSSELSYNMQEVCTELLSPCREMQARRFKRRIPLPVLHNLKWKGNNRGRHNNSWQEEECQAHGLDFVKFHGMQDSQPPVLRKPHYQKGENTSKKMATACLSPVFSGDRPRGAALHRP
jgi:hypothetical protein